MASYELTVVLAGKDKLDKIKKSIEEAGGKIEKVDEWGKKPLGLYFFMQVELPKDKAGVVNRIVEMNEDVLRHLLVRG